MVFIQTTVGKLLDDSCVEHADIEALQRSLKCKEVELQEKNRYAKFDIATCVLCHDS